MHEESLIRSLLRQVEELAQSHSAVGVEEIEVEVGPLSGVEPLLLQSAFSRLKADTAWPTAVLTIQSVTLDVRCMDCQSESQLDSFRFICGRCGSTALQVIRGDSFRLLNVRILADESISAAAERIA